MANPLRLAQEPEAKTENRSTDKGAGQRITGDNAPGGGYRRCNRGRGSAQQAGSGGSFLRSFPLSFRFMGAGARIERTFTGSKPVVLPLHYPALSNKLHCSYLRELIALIY